MEQSKDKLDWTRREVLRKSTIAAGGFTLGTAVAETTEAKEGGVGFLRGGSQYPHGLEKGDTFTITSPYGFITDDIGVECEANGKVREQTFTLYNTDITVKINGTATFLLWVKGNAPIDTPLTVKVNRVRDCGTLTGDPRGDFESDKITFSSTDS